MKKKRNKEKDREGRSKLDYCAYRQQVKYNTRTDILFEINPTRTSTRRSAISTSSEISQEYSEMWNSSSSDRSASINIASN